METVDDLINEATDARETKRALTVKMLQAGWSPQTIADLLNVSEQYVSKWKLKYEKDGAAGLMLAGLKPRAIWFSTNISTSAAVMLSGGF